MKAIEKEREKESQNIETTHRLKKALDVSYELFLLSISHTVARNYNIQRKTPEKLQKLENVNNSFQILKPIFGNW